MPAKLPSKTLRLFPHYENSANLTEQSPGLVISKVLEEGDQQDLRWLAGRFTEEDLATWLIEHASRLLTRRSRSFWRLVLDLQDAEKAPPGEPLWPL